MAKSNGSVIGVWLDAMKSGLEIWHEFTAHGRIKIMDEVRKIECMYSVDMRSEIGRIRDAVQLIGHNDEIGFKMELSEAMEHPILGREMSEMIDKLVELQKKMRFYEPDLNAYFCGFEDNDNDVNALNLALVDLFTTMSVSLTVSPFSRTVWLWPSTNKSIPSRLEQIMSEVRPLPSASRPM